MRKLVTMFLALAMMFSLVACGSSGDSTEEDIELESSPAISDISDEEDEESGEPKETKESVQLEILYNIGSDGKAEVVGFEGDGNTATIDFSYEGEDIVRIADSAFEDCTTLETILIFANIEEIGNYAFKGCTSLVDIDVPFETVFVGHHAFEGCTSLESAILWGEPDIGSYAFAGCTSLEKMSISGSDANVGPHAFDGCTALTTLTIWSVSIIDEYAFANCTSLESVRFPSEVLSIGKHAFDGCTSLSQVKVWGDDTAIAGDAFVNCTSLEDVPAQRGVVLSSVLSEYDKPGKVTEVPVPIEETEPEEIATVAPTPTPVVEVVESVKPEPSFAVTYSSTFSISDVPKYSGSPYVVVHNNVPYFTDSDMTTTSYEYYSSLDSLGRCGVCVACVGQDIMPTESRESISEVTPSGWNNVKYSGAVDEGWLYNRCHLLGFQLTAENANEKNLITGTRCMNVDGMLPFENMVADYVKETDNHVLYRVTPIFEGSNLVASGVLMEAKSVEDSGDGVLYCVYCYNVQPGVEINYADGSSKLDGTITAATEEPTATPSPSPTPTPTPTPRPSSVPTGGTTYILNTNTMKFHRPNCSSAARISSHNRREFSGTRAEVIAMGYEPCRNCNP